MKQLTIFIAGGALASGWWLYSLGIIPIPAACPEKHTGGGISVLLTFGVANLVALVWSLKIIIKAVKISWDE